VDFKFTQGPVRSNHRMQVGAYGLLLEDLWSKPARTGFIYLIPQETAAAVSLDETLKGRVRTALEEIRRALSDEAIPPPTHVRARCEDCEYRNFCGDVW
jgi:CRISPR-associated exonuclease Cas4